ncbi:MAG: NADH-quinone oxidoreductase subunit C [Candidatus Saganbacteria bacterium]|nr:NADH-quinone oxidoreductase subunit C [Candidatus Saganbacteria bacterium]
MNEELKQKIETKFADTVLDYKSPREKRIYMRIKKEQIKPVLSYVMNELGFSHLSTITGVDLKTEFEVLYHVVKSGLCLTIAIKVDRNDPHVDTITDIIPGAICYERELQDFFGIEVDNIPDGRRLIIPEDWPEGQYPLRKDWNKSMLPESFNDGLRRKWTE